MGLGHYAMQSKRSGHGRNKNILDRKGSLKELATLWRGRNVMGYAWALVPTGWHFAGTTRPEGIC
jgi:hypothetical protein